jgi:hypothetical protein
MTLSTIWWSELPLADGPLNQRVDAGEAYVFLGPFGHGTRRDVQAAQQSFTLYGWSEQDHFGQSVAIGNFNNDRFADVVIGAPNDSISAELGAAYVFLGPNLNRDATLGQWDMVAYGYPRVGTAVASANLNNDSFDDVVVGSNLGTGETFAIYGSSALPFTRYLNAQSPEYDLRTTRGGYSLSAGDVNADQIDDLFTAEADGVHIVRGSPTLNGTIDFVTRFPDGTINAGTPSVCGRNSTEAAILACSPGAAAADLNKDGVGDIVIGAPREAGPANTRFNAGEVHAVYGSAVLSGDKSLTEGLQQVVMYGAAGDSCQAVCDQLGSAVAAGDVDGDGIGDVIASAWWASTGPQESRTKGGETYVIFGRDDTDLDGIKDDTDIDDDADGYLDLREAARGGDPLHPLSTPEVCDGVDNNRNGRVDEDYPGVSWDVNVNAVKDCLDPSVNTDGDGIVANTDDPDDDGDSRGLTGMFPAGSFCGPPLAQPQPRLGDCAEVFTGYDTLDGCADNTNDDAWPPDLNNVTGVNALDFLHWKNAFYSTLGQSRYARRADLNTDKNVNVLDFSVWKLYFPSTCT